MSKPRLKNLPWCLAGLYFCWSLFIYFFADHAWWPLFLIYLLLPWSMLFEWLAHPLLAEWLMPDPKAVPPSAYVLFDRIYGAFYIVGGTIWYWVIGKVIFVIVAKLRGASDHKIAKRAA